MSVEAQHNLATAIEKLKAIERLKCFDPFHPDSRPTDKQEEVFKAIKDITARFVVSGNQVGKTTMGAREVSWIFEHNHPYWNTKELFPNQPLLLLVIGRVGEQVESEIWARKIKPFLTPNSYKEVRMGNALQRVIHKDTGNTIIFLSHHNINEAREKAQAYTAQYVLLDEMPKSLSFIIELLLRVQANNGRFLATFTPLIRDMDIKKYVESSEAPLGKKFQMSMLDNPIYKGREAEIIKRYENIPEDERNARLFGEWFRGGQAVYNFDPEKQLHQPEGYLPSWTHVEAVDPAASGQAGFILLANQPGSPQWHVVRAEYIKGAAASDLLDEIEKRTKGINIIRRISDPHEAWFIKEAAKRKRYYMGVYKKNERKNELIKNLQESLNDGKILVTPWAQLLVDELMTCLWKEGTDKIVGASRFHLLDCIQYANDNLPKTETLSKPMTFDQALKEANRERIKKEKVAIAKKSSPIGRIVARKGKRWRR